MQRGSAYSEKARYSRVFKLISTDEYDRLFGLAVKDHEQAIALDPDGRHYLAWDRLGLIHETTGELDQAVSDYL